MFLRQRLKLVIFKTALICYPGTSSRKKLQLRQSEHLKNFLERSLALSWIETIIHQQTKHFGRPLVAYLRRAQVQPNIAGKY